MALELARDPCLAAAFHGLLLDLVIVACSRPILSLCVTIARDPRLAADFHGLLLDLVIVAVTTIAELQAPRSGPGRSFPSCSHTST